MVEFILYSPKKEENARIIATVRDAAAISGEQSWTCTPYLDSGLASARLKAGNADLISWDVSRKGDRKAISVVRDQCREAFLLAVADKETSPLDFLTPAISPSSLILRPLTEAELARVGSEMVYAVRRQREAEEESGFLVVRKRDEQRRLPYRQIYYFEARGKKIYARLRGEEIGFADTLEQLEAELPETFQRCHRSYIVNMERVESVLLSQNLICLWDGLSVPVSRSFKKTIKEVIK